MERNLSFLYEKPGFQVFPTMVPAIAIRDIDSCFEIPELKALAGGKNIAEMLLHGEEELECVRPI
jgi:hypothetical protein